MLSDDKDTNMSTVYQHTPLKSAMWDKAQTLEFNI